jgi:DNA-binding transcriptional LysR family regulator
MELRTLRYFVVLADELHFGRAAQRLAITQPPLSLAIQRLEDEMGVTLLARTRRRVALTHAGSTFLEQARAILARADEAVQLARAADRGDVGRLTIGFMSASIFTLLPAVLREFAARHPGVRLDLRELTLPQQIAALRTGNLDVGFVRPPVTDAELTATPLLEEPLRVALPAGHPLTAAKRVRARLLAQQPFVMFQRSPGLVLHDLVLGFCLQQGFAPRVAQEASQTHAVVGLVSAGIGVALVPASAEAIRLRGVEFRPLAEKSPPVGTCLAWRRGDASPALRAFTATAQRVAARLPDRVPARRQRTSAATSSAAAGRRAPRASG